MRKQYIYALGLGLGTMLSTQSLLAVHEVDGRDQTTKKHMESGATNNTPVIVIMAEAKEK